MRDQDRVIRLGAAQQAVVEARNQLEGIDLRKAPTALRERIKQVRTEAGQLSKALHETILADAEAR